MTAKEERAESYVNRVVSKLDPQFKYDDGEFHFYDTDLEDAHIQGAFEQEAITRKEFEAYIQSKMDKYRGYDPGTIQSMIYKTYEDLLLWIKR